MVLVGPLIRPLPYDDVTPIIGFGDSRSATEYRNGQSARSFSHVEAMQVVRPFLFLNTPKCGSQTGLPKLPFRHARCLSHKRRTNY